MFRFEIQILRAQLILPSGELAEKEIQVRTHPITGKSCRITISRGEEREPGTETFPDPPPFAEDRSHCPFCSQNLEKLTPRFTQQVTKKGRFRLGKSIIIPNLFPYGTHSAVSIFDDRHFVEIGTADSESYCDGFRNAKAYLERILEIDPKSVFMAITQNHLPSAGGSLLHPHLQIQADPVASNYHRELYARAREYNQKTGRMLFSDYLYHEIKNQSRIIAVIGNWHWLAAFAPEGFFEIWGILPGVVSLRHSTDRDLEDLAKGIITIQRFYRSLNRNGYNLGLLIIEEPSSVLEWRVVMMVRSNYAPWVRSDHTGFECMLGDMATFTLPEDIAQKARPFFENF